jgi:TolA-binding protein
MVGRLVHEFSIRNNPKIGIAPRVLWDPDLPLTLTMKWMEDRKKFQPPLLLWKPFVLAHGGYDNDFSRRSEDLELQLRLERDGFELQTVESAVGFQNKSVTIRNLIEQEFMDGVSSVFLHSKFPDFMPQVNDLEALIRNEKQAQDAETAVDEIAQLEQSGSNILPSGGSQLYVHVCRHYLLHGILEGLKDIGDVKSKRPASTTVAIYNQASLLEANGDFDEARRLFRLVRDLADEEYCDEAEYHLGCIESELGNPAAAHAHFLECLRYNPGHNKARAILNKPAMYRETETNVFESIEPKPARVLFVVFGGLSNIMHAFPAVTALQERFDAETVWLTGREYVPLAKASFADAVYQGKQSEMIQWDWIHSEGFSHVFFAEPEANHDEWEKSRLHPIDFMAKKCGVTLETRRAWLDPDADAIFEAGEFLRQYGLTRSGFIAAWLGDGTTRHWPNSNLTKLAQTLDTPTIVFRRKSDPDIPGTIACIDKSYPVVAALIRWSRFYLGPPAGISWLATTTETPMGVFLDPSSHTSIKWGFRDALRGEKTNIQEWDIYTSLPTVLAYVESGLTAGVLARP